MNSTSRVIRSLQPSVRCFSSASTSLAPPTATKKVTKGGPKISAFAKAKRNTDEEGGFASGNVLGEVTLPLPDLSGIPNFVAEGLSEESLGSVQAFLGNSMTAFNTFGLPPLIQKEFAFTKKPCTVIRKPTLAVTQLLKESSTKPSQDARFILTGAPGSGKSISLLQSVSYALQTKWIVIYLPSARPLIDSSTPHVYSPQHSIFHQPQLSSNLLTKIAKVNKAALNSIKTSKEYNCNEKIIKVGESLNTLIGLGSDEKVSAFVLEAVLEELSLQTSNPVLLAIDDAQSLFATSSYLDPNYVPLESYSLSVPRTLLNFISGSKSFAKGMILLAPSPASAFQSKALNQHLGGVGLAGESIYGEILKGVKAVKVEERLERREAMGVVEMIKVLRTGRQVVTDQLFLERYVATDGNPREFVKSLGRNLSD